MSAESSQDAPRSRRDRTIIVGGRSHRRLRATVRERLSAPGAFVIQGRGQPAVEELHAISGELDVAIAIYRGEGNEVIGIVRPQDWRESGVGYLPLRDRNAPRRRLRTLQDGSVEEVDD